MPARRNGCTSNNNIAFAWLEQSLQNVQKSGFPSSIGPDESRELSFPQREVDGIQNGLRTKTVAHCFGFQCNGACRWSFMAAASAQYPNTSRVWNRG